MKPLKIFSWPPKLGDHFIPLETHHLKFIATWHSDPETQKFIDTEGQETYDELLSWYLSDYSIYERSQIMYIIQSPNPVGYLQLTKKINDVIEIGIVIGEKQKGHGTQALESSKNLLKYCRKVIARIFPDNFASQRVFEKVGFKKEGVLRKELFFRNEYKDVVLMTLLEEDIIDRT